MPPALTVILVRHPSGFGVAIERRYPDREEPWDYDSEWVASQEWKSPRDAGDLG